ncbi:MAG: hypothetical protein FK734_11100 [Asgard group archaeon]|nr:hypothetical protein [Asgard group archaeon]
MKPNNIKAEIDHILEYLSGKDPGTEEYQIAVDNLKVLCEAYDKMSFRIKPDVLAPVVGSLTLGFGILWHEKLAVITTKAFSLVGRRFV